MINPLPIDEFENLVTDPDRIENVNLFDCNVDVDLDQKNKVTFINKINQMPYKVSDGVLSPRSKYESVDEYANINQSQYTPLPFTN